jgi:hypothetical protein
MGATGPAEFIPGDAEASGEYYPGDDADASAPVAAGATNGHTATGNGGELPLGEAPRSEPRGGGPISWTGLALPEAAPAAAASLPSVDAAAPTTSAASYAIDTAELPELPTAADDPAPDVPQGAIRATAPDAAVPATAATSASAATASMPDATATSAPAGQAVAAPEAPPAWKSEPETAAPARVVWSSSPSSTPRDRGRED